MSKFELAATRAADLLLLAGLPLVGCANSYNANPISKDEIGAVVAEIKREVGEYQTASVYYKKHPEEDPALKDLPRNGAGAIVYVCGNGGINFVIAKAGVSAQPG